MVLPPCEHPACGASGRSGCTLRLLNKFKVFAIFSLKCLLWLKFASIYGSFCLVTNKSSKHRSHGLTGNSVIGQFWQEKLLSCYTAILQGIGGNNVYSSGWHNEKNHFWWSFQQMAYDQILLRFQSTIQACNKTLFLTVNKQISTIWNRGKRDNTSLSSA